MIYNYKNFLLEVAPVIKEHDAIEIIKQKCKEKGYDFNGFLDNKWIGKDTKLNLYCPKHNHSWNSSTYNNFKRDKSKCEFCSRESSSQIQMIPESKAIEKIQQICKTRNYEFKGFVDGWKGKKTYLILYCPKHNHTWNTTIYESFVRGSGCPKCGEAISKDSKRFSEEKAIEIIQDKCKEKNYDFLGFLGGKYINNTTKLMLFCNKPNHGKWLTATLNSLSAGVGCPTCGESKGEQVISKILIEFGYLQLKDESEKQSNTKYFIRQHFFDDCKSKRARKLPFDFYLPEHNLCIEYDGRQHFEPAFGSNNLEITKENDNIKTEYCTGKNGRPKILRIPYWEFKRIKEILQNNL